MTLLRGAIIRFVAAAALALALPATALAELPVRTVNSGNAGEITQLSGDRIVHRQAQFAFPATLDQMPASEAVVYGPGDVSVEYSINGRFGGQPWLTFYVFPARGEVGPTADIVEQIIVDHWAGKPMADAPAMPAATKDGRSGWFSATRGGRDYMTGYVLVQRGQWHLKARFTVPKEAGSDGVSRVASALAAAPWDWIPTN